jgi:spore coat polysaccharide biosynthesis protein SpsF
MILAIIQARIGSTRLPKKVLLDLKGKTVLEHVVERVKKSNKINELIVATTINIEDLEIVKLCSNKGIRVFCGSEDDVLDRFYQITKLMNPKHIVRITADCPLIDPDIINKTIDLHLLKNSDYTCNTLKETFPDGLDVEIFTYEALQKAWKEAKLTSEREHVTSYIRNHREIFKISGLENIQNLSKKRWTLDEYDDYKFLKIIFESVYAVNSDFRMDDILEYLRRNPDVEEINNHIIRNEGYLKSIREDIEIKTERI